MRRSLTFLAACAASAGLTWWLTSGSESARDGGLVAPARARATERGADESLEEPVRAQEMSALAAEPAPTPPETEARVAEDAAAHASAATDPAITLVHGRILDRAGKPIQRVFVSGVDANGDFRSARCEEDGSFLIVDLPPGEFPLKADSLGWRAEETLLELEPGTVIEHDFTLERAPMIGVRISTPDGKRLRDGLDEAGFDVRPRILPAATQDDPGTVLDPPHPWGNNSYGAGAWWDRRHMRAPPSDAFDQYGVLLLETPPPVWASLIVEQQVLRRVRVDEEDAEVHFVVSIEEIHALRGSLRLQVLDGDSDEPLAAVARLENHRSRRYEVGADGELALECWPGARSLMIEVDGRAPESVSFELDPGQALDLGTVRLFVPVPFSGKVTDAHGEPLSVDLHIESIEADPGSAPRYRTGVQTDSEGRFSCGGLPPGRYLVRVRGDDESRRPYAPDTVWTSGALEVDTRASERRDLVLTASAPTQVRVDAPDLAAPVLMVLMDEQGRVLRRRTLAADGPWSLKLSPGALTLVGTRAGEEVLRRSISVTAEPQRISLALH